MCLLRRLVAYFGVKRAQDLGVNFLVVVVAVLGGAANDAKEVADVEGYAAGG